jgi:hypothetical protein
MLAYAVNAPDCYCAFNLIRWTGECGRRTLSSRTFSPYIAAATLHVFSRETLRERERRAERQEERVGGGGGRTGCHALGGGGGGAGERVEEEEDGGKRIGCE